MPQRNPGDHRFSGMLIALIQVDGWFAELQGRKLGTCLSLPPGPQEQGFTGKVAPETWKVKEICFNSGVGPSG